GGRQQLVDAGEGVPAVADPLHPSLPGRIVEGAVGPAESEESVGGREAAQVADVCTEAHGQHAGQPREARAGPTPRTVDNIRWPRLCTTRAMSKMQECSGVSSRATQQ